MPWLEIMLLAYAVAATGSGFILFPPVAHTMGFDTQPQHADAATEAVTQLLITVTVIGLALIWPVTMLVHTCGRFVAASVE